MTCMQGQKKIKCQLRILSPEKLPFIHEGKKLKPFQINKTKELFITRSAL